jgi:arginase
MISKDITLIGIPLEEGSGRGGCAMGLDRPTRSA